MLSRLLFFHVPLLVIAARNQQQQAVLHDAVGNVGHDQQYLIETEPGMTQWVTEDEKWNLKKAGVNFMDITMGPFGVESASEDVKTVTFPTHTTQNDSIKPMLSMLDKDRMLQNLQKFTSFHTRYYKSETGAESSKWLQNKINETIKEAHAEKHGVHMRAFPHPWGQDSIIATIPGKSNKTIVVGAHQDSINLFFPSLLAAPGADDDGSGTVTILEAFRVLLTSDVVTHGNASNTIEFHWYSAEEGGLLGSQAIFSSYAASQRQIMAMLQQDMTGYTQGTRDARKEVSVGIITDYVDLGLTQFLKKIVSTYCTIPWIETKCGYACSDHASASKAGYPSAFIIESEFKYSDKRIHTTEDTLEKLDFDHMIQHARLTLGYAYELAFASF